MTTDPPDTIAVLLYDGFDELDAIGPYEVFSNAAAAGAPLDVGYYTLEPTDTITASHGTRIEPDGVLADADPALLFVPGGGWTDPGPGARAEAERGKIPEAVAAAHTGGVTVAGVCTGTMLLATAGLTDGRPAVTHQCAIEDLRESGADVREARYVDDGDLLTAGGVTSGIDLALYVVGERYGEDCREQVGREMEYEPRTSAYRG